MTTEERQLLLQNLCARLPYTVNALISYRDYPDAIGSEIPQVVSEEDIVRFRIDVVDIKPFLRPMESMTEEERAEMGKAIQKDVIEPYGEIKSSGSDNLLLCTIRQANNLIAWLLKNHFDYRGFIKKGLAIEVTEDNNPYERK